MRGALAAGILTFAVIMPAQADNLTYENERFGTRITFPLDVFDIVDPPPANGDGRRFRAADGAELAAYGQYNTLDQSPKTLLEWQISIVEQNGGTVTYSATGADWVVLSGTDGDTTFYQRHEFSGDGSVIHSMEMRYPSLGSALYDRLVGNIASTLEGP